MPPLLPTRLASILTALVLAAFAAFASSALAAPLRTSPTAQRAAAHTRRHHPAGRRTQAAPTRRAHARKTAVRTPRRAGRARPATLPRVRHHDSHATSTKPTAPSEEAAEQQAQAPAPNTSAVIAQVLATPCTNTELQPTAANIALVRGAVMCLINRERAEHGETPMKANADLERAGEEHTAELVTDDYFAHVTPSGYTPVDRIRATGYIPSSEVGYVIGENLAWGTLSLSTPASIVAAWVASPGHLANILEAQYTETGIGVYPSVPSSLSDGQEGATYAQEFGVILH